MQGPTLGVLGHSAFRRLPSYSLGRGAVPEDRSSALLGGEQQSRLVDLRFTCALRPSLRVGQ